MATTKNLSGPLPNGGVKGDVLFLDDDDDPVDEKKAAKYVIREMDEHGNVIHYTHGMAAEANKGFKE